MSRRTLLLILIAVLILLFIIGLSFFFSGDESGGDMTSTETGQSPFFPFEPTDESDVFVPQKITPRSGSATTENGVSYYLISQEPVAGAGWGTRKEEREMTVESSVGTTTETSVETVVVNIPYIRFVERATGHVFEVEMEGLTEERISNTTIAPVYRAWWSPNAQSVVLQTLNGDDFFQEATGLIFQEGEEGYDIETVPFPIGINSLSFSSSGREVSYLVQSDFGSRLFTSSIDGTGQRELWNTPLNDITSRRVGDRYFISTKPSGEVEGFTYTLAQGRLQKVIGNKRGLVVLPSENIGLYIYSVSQNTETTLFYKNTESNAEHELPITTLADKCVWSNVDENIVYCAVPRIFPQGVYPDAWYQGKVSFNDVLIEINLETLEINTLLNPSSFERPSVDMTLLTISADDSFISFVNKKDFSLWALRLKE